MLSTIRIGAGEADAVLGFDMVVAASPTSLATIAQGRTRIALDGNVTPTAAFVRDGAIDFRREAMLRTLSRAAGENALRSFAATSLATALMGDAIAGNMMLLGFAWQSGFVPVSRDSLMRAIALNGVAVKMNSDAFDWGRLAAVDPSAVERAAGASAPAVEEALNEIVDRRAGFLTDYQDAAYAARYRDLVARAAQAEKALTQGRSGFALAVARQAFKLMAYKDEYEVARLHSAASFRADIERQFEGDVKLRFHLAPPLLSRVDPRTGAPAKMAFGAWISPVFRALARLKRLRGTPFDPFGRSAERRTERQLVADYVALVGRLCEDMTDAAHPVAVALASIPDEIRGYGHVKAASIARADRKRADLLARLGESEPARVLAS
jgi:indolepyruvate ferredoxin oxidoreductase